MSFWHSLSYDVIYFYIPFLPPLVKVFQHHNKMTVDVYFTTLWANFADDKLMIYFLYFLENRLWHFMQIVSRGDNLLEMSKHVFKWKLKTNVKMVSAEILTQQCWALNTIRDTRKRSLCHLCEQRKPKTACASTQYDQNLDYLSVPYNIQWLYKRTKNALIRLCWYAGWSRLSLPRME